MLLIPDADPGGGVELRLAELGPGDLPDWTELRVPGDQVRHQLPLDVQPAWDSATQN